MKKRLQYALLGAAILTTMQVAAASGNEAAIENRYRNPLDVPAPATTIGPRSQLTDVSRSGKRMIAVGARGLILRSEDGGASWHQMPAPVSSDLLAVYLVDADYGWAVGHDGVVLHTRDGGAMWTKQFDGNGAASLLRAHFKAMAERGEPDGEAFLREVDLSYADGPEQALLDVWFKDRNNGFICGSFGTLFATHDGGHTWESWMERVDTRTMLHYNAITSAGGSVFLASERGTVFRLKPDLQRFEPRATGYKGSFFSLAANDQALYAFGLKGTAYKSADLGETWARIETGTGAAINAATLTDDGRLVLVTQNGSLLELPAGGDKFESLPVTYRTLYTGVAEAAPGRFAITSISGVQLVGTPSLNSSETP